MYTLYRNTSLLKSILSLWPNEHWAAAIHVDFDNDNDDHDHDHDGDEFDDDDDDDEDDEDEDRTSWRGW